MVNPLYHTCNSIFQVFNNLSTFPLLTTLHLFARSLEITHVEKNSPGTFFYQVMATIFLLQDGNFLQYMFYKHYFYRPLQKRSNTEQKNCVEKIYFFSCPTEILWQCSGKTAQAHKTFHCKTSEMKLYSKQERSDSLPLKKKVMLHWRSNSVLFVGVGGLTLSFSATLFHLWSL